MRVKVRVRVRVSVRAMAIHALCVGVIVMGRVSVTFRFKGSG